MRKHLSTLVVATALVAGLAGVNTQAQTPPPLNGYSAAVLSLNPLGYWPLTETVAPPSTPPVALNAATGANTIGATGNGQYLGGAITGVVTPTLGTVNTNGPLANPAGPTSTYFDRASGEVLVPYSSALTQSGAIGVTTSWTAEAWVNPAYTYNTVNGGTNGTTEWILGYGNFGNNGSNPIAGNGIAGYSGFGLLITGARLEVVIYNTNGTTVAKTVETANNTAGYIPQNTWTHVAAVFSNSLATTNLYLYINGVPLTNSAATGYNTVGLNFISDDGFGVPGTPIGTTFTVGCEPKQQNYFQGNIGQVAFYPSALNSNTLFGHYSAATNTATTSAAYATLINSSAPLLYLPLSENDAAHSFPVAANYSALGAAANGYYLAGTSPGGATGPAALGSPPAVTFPPATERSQWITTTTSLPLAQQWYNAVETGQALTVGPHVVMAPTNDLLLNINTNFVGGTANSNTTVLAWVNVPVNSDLNNGDPTGVSWLQEIAGRNDGSSWRLDVNATYYVPTNGFPGFIDFADGGLDNVAPQQVNDGTWHFIAATFNQTNTLNSIYIDGILKDQVYVNGLTTYSAISPMTVGAGAVNTTDDGRNFANGSVCGMAVYSNVLSLAQIDAIFGSTYSGIVTEPPSSVNFAGGTVTISAVLQGPNIQWYNANTGNPVGTGVAGEISGGTTEMLTFTPTGGTLPAADFTSYYAVVSDNSGDSATTSACSLVKLTPLTDNFSKAILALNPVGYWPLNDTGSVAQNYGSLGSVANGTYVADPSGVTHAFQNAVSGPSYEAGMLPSSTALEFGTVIGNGTMLGGAGVFIPNQTGLQIGGSNSVIHVPLPMTLIHWTQVVGTPSWFQSIVGKGDDSFRSDESEPAARFNLHTADETTPQSLADNAWHLWVGTWNGSNEQYIYIDGQLAIYAQETAGTGGQTHQLFFGGGPDYTTRNYAGNLADVVIYSNALSSSQVLGIWNSMYNSTVTVPANAYYVAGTAYVTLAASSVQAPYQQWYLGNPASGGTPILNNSTYSGAGTTMGSASPTGITIAASGSPLTLPPAAIGTYYLVVGDGNGTFNTSGPITVNVLPALTGAYDTAILAYNPILYMPLNETSGTTAYNYSPIFGAAMNGVIEQFSVVPNVLGTAGPPVVGFGGNNTAISFALSNPNGIGGDKVGANYAGTANSLPGGVSGNGVVIANTNLEIVSNFSIVTWALSPTFAYANANNQGYFFGQNNNSDADGIFLGVNGTAGQIFEEIGNGATIPAVAPNLNDGQWHLWTASYNATNTTASNYIDGVLVSENVVGRMAAGTNYQIVGTPTTIGSDDAGGFTRNFNGDLCRFAVLTNTLTASQVQALYSASGVLPYFTDQPAITVVANAGTSLTIGNAAVSGSQPITVTWWLGTPGAGTQISTGGRFTTTSSNLVISPVLATDAGSYYVQAANAFGTTNSPFTLTVNSSVTQTIYTHQNPTFVMGGAGPFSWSFSGTAGSSSGTTGGTFSLTNVTAGGNVVGSISGSPVVTYVVSLVTAPADKYPTAVLADSPIAYYRLDETAAGADIATGTIAHDYVGGYNGIYVADNGGSSADLTGSTTNFPYGPPTGANTDGAVAFGLFNTGGIDGVPVGPTNNYVGYINGINFAQAVSNSPAVGSDGDGEFSIEAWVYAGEGQANGGIVTKGFGYGDGNGVVGNFEQFSLQVSDVGSTGSRYDFCVRDSLGNLASAQSASFYIGYPYLPGLLTQNGIGFWHHLVGVCDQTNGSIKLYVNGLLAASNTIVRGNGILSTPVPMSIGAKQVLSMAGNYSGQLQGSVDDVAIYNYALTSNQVQNHYFATGVPPVILNQPTNYPGIGGSGITNASENSTVNLHVVAYGSPTALAYQWYDYNGGAPTVVNTTAEPGETGATSANLTLASVINDGTTDTIGSGTFFCKISNLYGSTNSALVVISPHSGPPVYTQNLGATTYAIINGTAVFGTAVSGSFPQTNTWTYSPLGGGPTVVLTGNTHYAITSNGAPTLYVTNVTAADLGTYRVYATNKYSQAFNNGPTASTASALLLVHEPTFFGTGQNWDLVTGAGDVAPNLPGIIGNNLLELTGNQIGQQNAFWYSVPQYCGAFQASFTYQSVQAAAGADGFSFCLQNDPAGLAAFGGGGGDIGYGGAEAGATQIVTNSVAIGFDIYTGHTRGWEFLTNGWQTFAYAGVTNAGGTFLITSGNLENVVIKYDGNSVTLTVADQTTGGTYSNNVVVGPIAPFLGGSNYATIGFTGATGGVAGQQNISAFTYVPIPLLTATLSGANVILTWPAVTGIQSYVLQSAPSVPSALNGASFTTVGTTPTVVNGNYQVSVPANTATATYYRLSVTLP